MRGYEDSNGRTPRVSVEVESIQAQPIGKLDHHSRKVQGASRASARRSLAVTG
jgi:hypothetical protein